MQFRLKTELVNLLNLRISAGQWKDLILIEIVLLSWRFAFQHRFNRFIPLKVLLIMRQSCKKRSCYLLRLHGSDLHDHLPKLPQHQMKSFNSYGIAKQAAWWISGKPGQFRFCGTGYIWAKAGTWKITLLKCQVPKFSFS